MNWSKATLREIVSRDRGLVQTGPFGSQLHQADYTEEGIPVIMPTNISDGRVGIDRIARVTEPTADRLARHKLKPRTIVLPRRGEITKRAFIREEQDGWLCGSGCLKIETHDTDVLPEFLYYYMAQHDVARWLEQHAVGSTMLNLSAGIVNEMPVHFPSRKAQENIAETLSAYDDLMENNRRRMALLEESARLLYREWFVRLRFPGHEHVRITNGTPEGWERVPVPEAIEINPTTKLSDEEEHWYVEMSDLPTDSMVIQNAIKRDGRSGSKFRNGDTLLARITPCLENGKTGFVNFMAKGEAGRGSTEFIVLRSKRVTPEFVYCLARTYEFRGNAIKSMVGSSGRQRVQETCFEKFLILIPPRTILDLFSDFAAPAFQQIHNLHKQNQKLRAARDLLLPKLMSGEISV
jgi:type I restriction enzyme S subunit